MCRFRLWRVVAPRASLERTRIVELGAGMALRRLDLMEDNSKLIVGVD
jgi:hypothetical protein